MNYVSIDEGLPEYDLVVLVRLANGKYGIGKRTSTDKKGHHWDVAVLDGVAYCSPVVRKWRTIPIASEGG